ncbi:hypothetical protein CKK19_14840 [Enterobacter sp. CCUG 70166]|nr:hypothetical protein [Enterobacter sp. CCUG 70166]
MPHRARIGAGWVPVKDRFEHNGRGKRKNERRGESKTNAANYSTLWRIWSFQEVAQKKILAGSCSPHEQNLDIMEKNYLLKS